MAENKGDSPTRHKHTHDAEYRALHVATSRKTLNRDIPGVPEVMLSSLMDAVLPPLPPDILESTFGALAAGGHIKNPQENKARWACLPQDPQTSKQKEDLTFKFLEEIAKAIKKSHPPESHKRVALRVAGHITPLSFRHDTSRPDGFMHLTSDPSRPVEWADIVMPMEFKNEYEEGKIKDDSGKVIWEMHHILRADARRTHVYGLTCENTKARLWHGDRSDIVVSTEFDVNKDWKHLVRIILSLLLASPAQLGYDPTMVAHSSNDSNSEPTYDITVHNSDTNAATQYRTICMLSDVGADSPVGRATRVWEVQKLVDGVPVGPSYALKDVWVHDNRPSEHKVLKEIREDQKDYAQYFLTPLDYGYVPHDPAEPLIADNTHTTIRRQKLRSTGRVLRINLEPAIRPSGTISRTKSAARDSVGHFETAPNLSGEGNTYLSRDGREHYRMVVEEIGKPVHQLRNFTDIFTAVQGGWEGLHAVHLSKRVHRDVSSGNILLVPASGALGQRGVIMDLEYAKKVNDTRAPRGVRTGTEAFMATEVALAQHHRLSSLRISLSIRIPSQRVTKPRTRGLRPPLPPFCHNPLHDMESVWWLCIWVMFCLVPSNIRGEQYIDNYRQVFTKPIIKHNFMCVPEDFPRLTTHLSKIAPLVEVMGEWQEELNQLYDDCYMAQESSSKPLTRIRIDDDTVKRGYTIGKQFLDSLKSASEQISTEFITLLERHLKNQQSEPRLELDGVFLPAKRQRRE